MPDWTRSERVTSEVTYTLRTNGPFGACWNQVQQTLTAAVDEYRKIYGKWPADDALRVHPGDDEITFTFTKKLTDS